MRPGEDPVDAYNRIAPAFSGIAAARRCYNDAVESLIVTAIAPGSHSLLDVGAGDGSRAVRIAVAAGVTDLILLEPGEAMRARSAGHLNFWPIRAESLHERDGQFDVITCLWNVLGHIFPAEARRDVLRQMVRLLAPGGRIFIDVNHRYNARHYGIASTLLRMLHDSLSPSETNGDVTVTWEIDGASTTTAGHVFTDREFTGLCGAAGITVEKRFVVDYATGEQRRFTIMGNLLYVLKT